MDVPFYNQNYRRFDYVIPLGAGYYSDGNLKPTSILLLEEAVGICQSGWGAKIIVVGEHLGSLFDREGSLAKTGAAVRARLLVEKYNVPKDKIVRVHRGGDTLNEAIGVSVSLQKYLREHKGIRTPKCLVLTTEPHERRADLAFLRFCTADDICYFETATIPLPYDDENFLPREEALYDLTLQFLNDHYDTRGKRQTARNAEEKELVASSPWVEFSGDVYKIIERFPPPPEGPYPLTLEHPNSRGLRSKECL